MDNKTINNEIMKFANRLVEDIKRKYLLNGSYGIEFEFYDVINTIYDSCYDYINTLNSI